MLMVQSLVAGDAHAILPGGHHAADAHAVLPGGLPSAV